MAMNTGRGTADIILSVATVRTLKPFYLFLDIDGVLINDTITCRAPELAKIKRKGVPVPPGESLSSDECDQAAIELFDKSALANLRELIAKIEGQGFQAHIVLSSDWRKKRETTEELKEFFKYHDFLSSRIFDKTPVLKGNDRANEIQQWLEDHDVCIPA